MKIDDIITTLKYFSGEIVGVFYKNKIMGDLVYIKGGIDDNSSEYSKDESIDDENKNSEEDPVAKENLDTLKEMPYYQDNSEEGDSEEGDSKEEEKFSNDNKNLEENFCKDNENKPNREGEDSKDGDSNNDNRDLGNTDEGNTDEGEKDVNENLNNDEGEEDVNENLKGYLLATLGSGDNQSRDYEKERKRDDLYPDEKECLDDIHQAKQYNKEMKDHNISLEKTNKKAQEALGLMGEDPNRNRDKIEELVGEIAENNEDDGKILSRARTHQEGLKEIIESNSSLIKDNNNIIEETNKDIEGLKKIFDKLWIANKTPTPETKVKENNNSVAEQELNKEKAETTKPDLEQDSNKKDEDSNKKDEDLKKPSADDDDDYPVEMPNYFDDID